MRAAADATLGRGESTQSLLKCPGKESFRGLLPVGGGGGGPT